MPIASISNISSTANGVSSCDNADLSGFDETEDIEYKTQNYESLFIATQSKVNYLHMELIFESVYIPSNNYAYA